MVQEVWIVVVKLQVDKKINDCRGTFKLDIGLNMEKYHCINNTMVNHSPFCQEPHATPTPRNSSYDNDDHLNISYQLI